jgi:DNA-nicking Smr family endonuclease
LSEEQPAGDDAFELPITGELDLHAFAPRDVASVVEEYLLACRERGLLRVRVVHGRGKGVQRAVVQRVLRGLPWVAGFSDAPPEAGGWGATLVELRETRHS